LLDGSDSAHFRELKDLLCMPAAARAAESLRADAFVVDPLAYILAGPKAMAKYKVGRVADSLGVGYLLSQL
jgi:hypothetical protein